MFTELVTGFAAVDEAVKSTGAQLNVRLLESFSETGDMFPFLRRSETAI